ncbi:Fc.00g090850.m01.CDS01 [Cosmosporella sp. VM-42]
MSSQLALSTVIPATTTTTTTTGTDKRNASECPPNPQPPKRAKTLPFCASPVSNGSICDFCRDHPEGKLMHAQRPCNWYIVTRIPIECQNCADYRKQHRNEPGTEPHSCGISFRGDGTAAIGKRIYASDDPVVPEVTACDLCYQRGFENSCDVDYALRYGCFSCGTRDCTVNGEVLEKHLVIRQPGLKWFRHACDTCVNAPKVFEETCSWLQDRSQWRHRCTSCRDNNELCLEAGTVVEGPPRPQEVPTSWELALKTDGRTTSALARSVWRRACQACFAQGQHCGVDMRMPYNACKRCNQLGIDCISQDNVFYPIYDLSRIGFGIFMPFQPCRPCMAQGRNCDHQRPCDSCQKHGDNCDKFVKKTNNSFNCFPRFSTPPGILYYLAMGHGANGIDDDKNGTQVEHWVGPLRPVYGMNRAKEVKFLCNLIIAYRSGFVPEGMPPHGAGLQSPLWHMKPSQLTVQQLRQMILTAWPGAVPPATRSNYQEKVTQLMRVARVDDSRDEETDQSAPAQSTPQPTPQPAQPAFGRAPNAGQPLPLAHPAPPPTAAPQPSPTGSFPPATPIPAAGLQFGVMVPHGGNQTFQSLQDQNPLQFGVRLPQGGNQTFQSLQAQDPRTRFFQSGLTFRPADPTLESVAPAPRSTDLALRPIADPPGQSWRDRVPTPRTGLGGQSGSSAHPLPPAQQAPAIPQPSLPRGPIPNSYGYNPHIRDDAEQVWGIVVANPENYEVDLFENATSEYQDNEQEQQPSKSPLLRRDVAPDGDEFFPMLKWHMENFPEKYSGLAQLNNNNSPSSDAPLNTAFNSLAREFNIANTINPFLGSVWSPNLQIRMPVASVTPSRWQVASKLETIDMSHWHQVNGEAGPGPNEPKLFGTVKGQAVADVPSRDILKDIPLEPKTTAIADANLNFCMEPNAGGRGFCGTAVQDLVGCQSATHANTLPGNFLVCDACTDSSANILLEPTIAPITANDIFSMRAYLCTSCGDHVSQNPQNMASLRDAGAARVWGRYAIGLAPDGVFPVHSACIYASLDEPESIEYKTNVLPATGCACGTKLFDRKLCRFHRLYYADQAIRQAALMQEWRVRTFGKAVCPACLQTKTAAEANISADHSGFQPHGLTAWACLVCNDWVVNQANDSENKAQVIPGFWRNGTVSAQGVIYEMNGGLDNAADFK